MRRCSFFLTGDFGSIGRAEAVRKDALAEITLGGGVGVFVDGAGDLVGGVAAVGLAVAEQGLLQALAVAALKLAIRTHGLVRLEVGPGNPGLGQLITIVDLATKESFKSLEH